MNNYCKTKSSPKNYLNKFCINVKFISREALSGRHKEVLHQQDLTILDK
jgi:hypothetical protein